MRAMISQIVAWNEGKGQKEPQKQVTPAEFSLKCPPERATLWLAKK